MLYNNLNKIFKKINQTVNKDIKYKLIVDIFAQELKKYNNYYYYFVILRILLLENNGDEFKYSKKYF